MSLFYLFSSRTWNFWDHKGGASAKSYIPEAAWNRSGDLLRRPRLRRDRGPGGPAPPDSARATSVPPSTAWERPVPGSGGAKVFHDIVQGRSDVPGTPGYACGPGYDLATGLGSLDAKALVNALAAPR